MKGNLHSEKVMAEIVINIALACLSAYIVFEYYRAFFKMKTNKAGIAVILLIYVGWQIFSMPSVSNIHAIVRLVLSILSVVFVGGCFYGSVIGKNVFAIIYNAMWMLSELLVSAFFLNGGIPVEGNDLLGSFLCESMLLILVKLLAMFFRHDTIRNFSWKYNGILMMIPLGFMFFSYHLFMLSAKSQDKIDLWVSVVAFLILLVVMSLIFVMYIKLLDAYEVKRRSDLIRLELDLYMEHMKEQETGMTEFRKFRHDLKHKLVYISELFKNREYEKLESYMEELADLKYMDGWSAANTGNSFVDTLINSKYMTAKKNGIDFRLKLDIPYDIPFDYADLCVLLGNALDNAIEANLDLETQNPYIDLKIKYDLGNLLIFLENSFDGNIEKDDKGRIVTRKTDKMNHGLGLNSIQSILMRYNGYMNVDITENVYKLTMIMYSQKENKL